MDSASHGFSAAQESKRQLFRHCLTLPGSLRLILVERLVGFPPEFFVPFAFELVLLQVRLSYSVVVPAVRV